MSHCFSRVPAYFIILCGAFICSVLFAHMADSQVKLEDQLALLERDENYVAIINKLEDADKNSLLHIIKSNFTPTEELKVAATGGGEAAQATVDGKEAAPQVQIPKLGCFSGDEPLGKGEIPYDQWKQEVDCLVKEGYSGNIIMLSVRRSLKSTAASVLLNLGVNVVIRDVLAKFDVVFGNILPSEMLLEKFYTARQNDTESVVAWGCRIESLLNKAKEQGTIQGTEDMARTKFWSGIRHDKIKAALRHRFDAGDPFQELLKKARMLEQEFQSVNPSAKIKTQSVDSSDLKKVLDRIEKLEKSLAKVLKGQPTVATSDAKSEPQTFCRYCKKTNHVIENCYVLARKKAKAEGAGNGGQSVQRTED